MSEFKVGDIVKVDIPPTLYLSKSITGYGRIIKIKTEFRTEVFLKSYDVNMLSEPYSGMTFSSCDEAHLSKLEHKVEATLYQDQKALINDIVNKCKLTMKEEKGVIKVENKNVKIPEIDRVIFNNPATIIFWKAWHYEDKYDVDKITCSTLVTHLKVQDKTVVKCAPGEKFNKYNGFCAAVAKYIFGTNSEVNRIVKNGIDDKPENKLSSKKTENGDTDGDKTTRECKYFKEKCGRKYTCKQVYSCDGVEKLNCKMYREYQKNEHKKNKRKGTEQK